ncbi:MAG TPA: sulfite reductase subunit C [Victivallales bacterium]|nr:sulfite reductase subunit C [Victivallales bacterium]
MSLDINRKTVAKNAFRITKLRGRTALRIRVPGGHLNAKYLDVIRHLAEKYGDGSVHITIRQGFELPGMRFEDIPAINKELAELIKNVEIPLGVAIANPANGYPSAGTRNISACIGNRVCPFANFDTTSLAFNLEKEIYPNDFHVKIAVTGCPNDCIKAHLQDFGIIGMAEPQYEQAYCIACEACVKNCKKRVTNALSMHKGLVVRNPEKCIGCGECVLKCPTAAWTRKPKKFYRLIIMGRTGKKNPRLAATFLSWVSEDAIVKIIKNVYSFIDKHIDRSLDKEHVGYIVDRVGYDLFKSEVLRNVELNPEVHIASRLENRGYLQGTETY